MGTKFDNQTLLPMHFFMCKGCTHCYNLKFDEKEVQYDGNSNVMYNKGIGWATYIKELISSLSTKISKNSTILEIGCGDGSFLRLLKEHIPDATYVGIDPSIDSREDDGIRYIQDYAKKEHYDTLKPDLIIMRHFLEHLSAPFEFMKQLVSECNDALIYIEVPRFDNSLRNGHYSDFLYEHVSNFTSRSMRTLLENTNCEDVVIDDEKYGGEIICAYARPAGYLAHRFKKRATDILEYNNKLFSELVDRYGYKNIVFWGGTGKSSAFINSLDHIHAKIVRVIDSDERKVGLTVPGTKVIIENPKILETGIGCIVITTAWRAKDIISEIKLRGIEYSEIIIF